MTEEEQEGLRAHAEHLDDVTSDDRVLAVLEALRKRIGQGIAQAATELHRLGLNDDDIDDLVNVEAHRREPMAGGISAR